MAVTKTWDDENNKWGIRPNAIVVSLEKSTDEKTWTEVEHYNAIKLGPSNNWTYVAQHLPVYENGQPLLYRFREESVNGYEQLEPQTYQHMPVMYKGEYVQTDVLIGLVNKLDLVNIPIQKVWVDNSNAGETRPETITIELLADGKVIDEKALSKSEVQIDGDAWNYIFTGLPKYNANGAEVRYTVREANVDKAYVSEAKGLTITNTLIPTTFRTIGKAWVHTGNSESMYPASVKMTLLADGKPATYIDGSLVGTIVLNAANRWEYTVENLPVTKDGKTIKYTWDEAEVLSYSQTGYKDTEVEGGVETVITNTYRRSGSTITNVTNNTTNNTTTTTTNNVTNNTGTTVMRGGGGTIINNFISHETVVEPQLPGEPLIEIDDYGTPLGINVVINHVGDCFD